MRLGFLEMHTSEIEFSSSEESIVVSRLTSDPLERIIVPVLTTNPAAEAARQGETKSLNPLIKKMFVLRKTYLMILQILTSFVT